jgi:starch synthase
MDRASAASPRLAIAHLASEMTPLVKVGGLGDVVGSLGAEQARRGHRVTVAVPAYRALVVPEGWTREQLAGADVPWGMGRERARFELLHAPSPDGGAGTLRVLLVGHAGERRFYERPGIYNEPATGAGYADNAERFLFFARAALEGLKVLGDRVDVLHAHDQQAAWAPCLVRTQEARARVFRGATTVFTIHNLGYQGIYDPWVLGLAGFPGHLFHAASPFEFWGRVNYMKVGLAFADLLSTVSPRYAQEIQQDGEYGFGLEGVLRRRGADLRGILNGIDERVWDPARDHYLAQTYDSGRLEDKAANHAALAAECGFAPGRPIVGMVTRLVDQKGLDLLELAMPALLELGADYVVLGHGQARHEEWLELVMAEHPARVSFCARQDERLAHRIEGGADLFLMPSRYEPCGLNQMYSLRYGTVPVVRETGGLADTVEEFDLATRQGTGFRFGPYEPDALIGALKRALAIQKQPELWRALQRNGMSRDFSWRASADGYDRLYTEALERVRAGRVPTLESVKATLKV